MYDTGVMTLDPERHFSPSYVALSKFCPRKHTWKYTKNLGIVAGLDYKMMFGGMWHKAAETIDSFGDVDAALKLYADQIRLAPTYVASDSLYLDRAAREVKKVVPKYLAYLNTPLPASWKTIDVETTIFATISGHKVKCIPDKVVEEGPNLWVVERKTTARDDDNWDRQWKLNFQTSMEAIIAEKHYGKPVAGVYIEQVVVTRKRQKNLPKGAIQDIHKVTFYPPRPVNKEPHIKRETERYLDGCIRELEWRHKEGLEWEPNFANCWRCEMHNICRGKVPAEQVLVELQA